MEISNPNPLEFDSIVELVISNLYDWEDLLSCRLVNILWSQLATRRINKEKCCSFVLRATNIDEYLDWQTKSAADGIDGGEGRERKQGQVLNGLKVLKLDISLSIPAVTGELAIADANNDQDHDQFNLPLKSMHEDTSMLDKAKALLMLRLPGKQLIEFISVKLDSHNSPRIHISREFEEAFYAFVEICSPTLRHLHISCRKLLPITPIIVYKHLPTFPHLKSLHCNVNGPESQFVISSAPTLTALTLLTQEELARIPVFVPGTGRIIFLIRRRRGGLGAMLNAFDSATLANLRELSINLEDTETVSALVGKQFPALRALHLHRLTAAEHVLDGQLAAFLATNCSSELSTIDVHICVHNYQRHRNSRRLPRLVQIPFPAKANLPQLPHIKRFKLTQNGGTCDGVDDQRHGFKQGRKILGNLIGARNAFPELETIELNAVGCYQLARMFILSDRLLPIPPEYLTRLDFQNVTTFQLTVPDSFCLARTQSSVSHLLGKLFPHVRALSIGIEFKSYGMGKWHSAGQSIVRFYLNHFQGIKWLEINNYFQHFLAEITKEEPNPIKDLDQLILRLPAGLTFKQILTRPPFSEFHKCKIRYVVNKRGQLKKRRSRPKLKAGDKRPRPPSFQAEMEKLQENNPQLEIEIHRSVRMSN